MVKRIDWSKTALKKINEIIAYMKQNASDKAARDFVDAVYKQIESLKNILKKADHHPKPKLSEKLESISIGKCIIEQRAQPSTSQHFLILVKILKKVLSELEINL